jgi:hypothetical protein
VSIGQAVATTSDVTFAKITGTGVSNFGNIKSGYIGVTVTANVVSSVSVASVGLVTSAETADGDDISVTATQNSSRPDQVRAATVGNFAFSGSNMTSFTIYIFRTNGTDTGVYWMAIGR